MAIETLEDIVENMADALGFYGAHEDDQEKRDCRVCFTTKLTSRIREAIRIERLISLGKTKEYS